MNKLLERRLEDNINFVKENEIKLRKNLTETFVKDSINLAVKSVVYSKKKEHDELNCHAQETIHQIINNVVDFCLEAEILKKDLIEMNKIIMINKGKKEVEDKQREENKKKQKEDEKKKEKQLKGGEDLIILSVNIRTSNNKEQELANLCFKVKADIAVTQEDKRNVGVYENGTQVYDLEYKKSMYRYGHGVSFNSQDSDNTSVGGVMFWVVSDRKLEKL